MAVVVSLLEEDLPRLAEALRLQAPLADVVELRLDRIGELDPGRLAELIAASPRPVIATVHGAEGFGDLIDLPWSDDPISNLYEDFRGNIWFSIRDQVVLLARDNRKIYWLRLCFFDNISNPISRSNRHGRFVD